MRWDGRDERSPQHQQGQHQQGVSHREGRSSTRDTTPWLSLMLRHCSGQLASVRRHERHHQRAPALRWRRVM